MNTCIQSDLIIDGITCKLFPRCHEYAASMCGKVWSFKTGTWKKMKLTDNGRGYKVVGISYRNKQRQYFVHRIVLETFVCPKPAGFQARHLDGNPSNNHLSNLKWGTALENADDRLRHGMTPKAELHARSKLTNQQAVEIKSRISSGELHSSIAKDYGVDKTLISHIACGRIWSSVGRNMKSRKKCKLTESEVAEIRIRRSTGERNKDLAMEYGVSQSTITMVCQKKRWPNIK